MKPTIFNVNTVALHQSNLIEASAGTGKTYSIGILVLRFLLEKRIPVEKILMVTYTNAAVDELSERIRKFVRLAYSCVIHSEIEDDNIAELVDKAVKVYGSESIAKVLREAILFLDELAIFTIHGFCQRTLAEFAYETGQMFGVELVGEEDEFINQAFNQFWRSEVTTLPIDTLEILVSYGFSKDDIGAVVKQHRRGFVFYPKKIADFEEVIAEYQLKKELLDCQKKDLIALFCQNYEELKQSKNRFFLKLIEGYTDMEELFRVYKEKAKSPPKYLMKESPQVLEHTLEYLETEEVCDDLIQCLIDGIAKSAIEYVDKVIDSLKASKAVFTFDDLILQLHKAVMGDRSEEVRRALRFKYQAVFIDEFQDTDKVQYEIFYNTFHHHQPLFYIGDPKQAIYAFRKADLETYKKARKHVDHIFTMNKNFRSTHHLISAMNHFFQPVANFDPFLDDDIKYINVEAGTNPGEFSATTFTAPITVLQIEKGEEKSIFLNDVINLLHSGKINGNQVKPSDIGVLVRGKKEGQEAYQALRSKGIPAVVVDDVKVLETEEKKLLLYLLEAIQSPSRASIIKAMYSPLFGVLSKDIDYLNHLKLISIFGELNDSWSFRGVYNTLQKIYSMFSVKDSLMKSPSGERMLTNVLQLTELLHVQSKQKNYSLTDLINWLRNSSLKKNSGDEYLQRIENDEEAVNIVTIHKSKGLAYPLVLAYKCNLSYKKGNAFKQVSFRDHELDDYVFTQNFSEDNICRYELDTDKENRRLLYVAVTRAKYGVIIYQNQLKSGSTFKAFWDINKENTNENLVRLKDIDNGAIEEECFEIKYQDVNEFSSVKSPVFTQISRLYERWGVYSYSILSNHHHSKVNDGDARLPAYDHFIFRKLPRGILAGDFLHYIFENIDFSDEIRWRGVLERASLSFSKVYDAEHHEEYVDLIKHVVGAKIPSQAPFCLREINWSQRLTELEFYYDFDKIDRNQLNQLSDFLKLDKDVFDGTMYGFIDLVFEQGGKYFILDWKSNYLGDDLVQYSQENLEKAMFQSDYHLQYYIYIVALIRYLRQRVIDFDYEQHFGGVCYLYVRGARKNKSSGVYFNRPTYEQFEGVERSLLSAEEISERSKKCS